MIRMLVALLVAASSASASDLAPTLAPTGTLRAAYIAANPVQASIDPTTKETRGPAAAIAGELARRAGVPLSIVGVRGVDGVINSVKNGEADIGFVAFDAVRAEQVDFSQNYALAQNTFLVTETSPIRSVADVDRPGVRIGVGARDAGDYFLTRTLKSATLVRNDGGVGDAPLKALLAGELDAYAGNRMRLHEAAKKTPGLARAGQFLWRRTGGDRPERQCGAAGDHRERHPRRARVGPDRGCDRESRSRRGRCRAGKDALAFSLALDLVRTGAALPDHACENESGTEPKLDPAIRFYQYAGATIAHQQTHEQFAMRCRTGQVNNT
jgi:polar amino acid transport system substrate-binding protein